MIRTLGVSRTSSTFFLYASPRTRTWAPRIVFPALLSASIVRSTTWYGIDVLISPASWMKRVSNSYSCAFHVR